MALIEVRLLGELGRRFGRSFQFVADTPKQVISALSNQLPGFRDYLVNAHERGIAFRLVDEDPDGLSYENLLMPVRRLIIAPLISGSGAIGRILLGVALVALSFVSFGAGTAFAGFVNGAFAAGSGALFNLGLGLVVTGIASLISPQPQKESKTQPSYLFSNSAETTIQGQPIPVLYGRFLAAAPLVVSASVTTYQVPV